MPFSEVLLPRLAQRRQGQRGEAQALLKDALSRAELRRAVLRIHPEPTPGQREALNYRQGHITWRGLPITVEVAKGGYREGVGKDGHKWRRHMKCHYGRIKGTQGADGEHVDVFLGDDPESDVVVCVNQIKGDGSWDEHKFLLGCSSVEHARKMYLAHYPDGWKTGEVVDLTFSQFKEWLESGDHKKPLARPKVADHGKRGYVGERCPSCGQEAVGGCRCKIGDAWCANDHRWHHCLVHRDRVVLGSGHGAGGGCTCGADDLTKDGAAGGSTGTAPPAVYFCPSCQKEHALARFLEEKEAGQGVLKYKVPTVAVDLDGTLAEYTEWKGPDHFGKPRRGAKKMLEEFQRRGYRIIIWTCRKDHAKVRAWLHEHELPFDYINEHPDAQPGDSPKVHAHAYVDDRAVSAGRLHEATRKVIALLGKEATMADQETRGPRVSVAPAWSPSRLLAGSLGRLAAAPEALLTGQGRAVEELKGPTYNPEKHEDVARAFAAVEPSLRDTAVHLGGSRPLKELGNLWRSQRVNPVTKLLATPFVPLSGLSHDLARVNRYSPFSDTATIYSGMPEGTALTLGAAADINRKPRALRMLYALLHGTDLFHGVGRERAGRLATEISGRAAGHELARRLPSEMYDRVLADHLAARDNDKGKTKKEAAARALQLLTTS